MAVTSLNHAGAVLRRLWWIPAILVTLVLLYTAGGFWLVPRLARSYTTDYVEKTLKRHVAMGDITFNPYSFTAEIKNFALTEADNAPIASFDFLHVDFELASLFNGAWTFKEVRLDNPNISVLVGADGSLNLAKLKPPAPAATASAAKPAAPAVEAAMPSLRIATLAVHRGRVGLEDKSRGAPFATTLTPIEFTLNDFRTAPNFQNEYRFEASTTAGEKLTWAGKFSIQPLGSTGTFAVGALKTATVASYLQDALPFRLVSGTVDLDGQYKVTLADAMGLSVDLPALKVHDVGIAPRGTANEAPWITVPETVLMGISVQLPERRLAVQRVDVGNAKVAVWREADGKPNLLRLLAPAVAASTPPASPAAPAAAPKSPFAIQVGVVALKDAAIAAEDRMMQPATKMTFSPVSLNISGYNSDPNPTLKIDGSIGVGKARISAAGDVKTAPFATTMTVDIADFDMAPAQPYIAMVSGVQLLSGQISTKGKVTLNPAPAKGQSGLQFTGDVTVANLATRDAALRQDFIKWQRMQLTGVDFRQGPDSLTIDRIRAQKLFGKLVIAQDLTLNIGAVLKAPNPARTRATVMARPAPPPAKAAAGVQQASATAPARRPTPRGVRQLKPVAAAVPKSPTAMPIRIKQIVLEDGSMDFADFSIQPNFAAAISSLAGTINGLSSDPASRAQVKLTGSVDRYAPVDISGTLNVLSASLYTDIAMNFRNMELTSLNPYSGKYAGYAISKGKLTTELHYKVDNRKLDATHHVILDQLEFGQATDSKDAVPLPIRLAVALLKDRNGVIDLNLPVSGSLDDPQFQIGPIVWQVFVGLITKIVEAPFALIGSLFGGGEELAYVDFAPGSAMIATAEMDKIGKVAHGLAERPGLKLDIPLKTLTPADDVALANAAYNEAVEDLLPENMPATPAQRMAALAKLYEQQLGMKPVYPAPPDPPVKGFDPVPGNIDFLEQALKPKFAATEAAREALAKARAEAVQQAVLNQEGVQPERVFLSERESAKGSATAARMELNLQ